MDRHDAPGSDGTCHDCGKPDASGYCDSCFAARWTEGPTVTVTSPFGPVEVPVHQGLPAAHELAPTRAGREDT